MTKTALLLVLSSLSLGLVGCASAPREAMYGQLEAGRTYEAFNVTAWGIVPTFDQLVADFPGLVRTPESDQRLRQRRRGGQVLGGAALKRIRDDVKSLGKDTLDRERFFGRAEGLPRGQSQGQRSISTCGMPSSRYAAPTVVNPNPA